MVVMIDSPDTNLIQYFFDFKDEATVIGCVAVMYDNDECKIGSVPIDLGTISDETLLRAEEMFRKEYGPEEERLEAEVERSYEDKYDAFKAEGF